MQRYHYKYQIKVGNRIVLDNSSGFISEFPKINMVGEVISISEEENSYDMTVEFEIDGEKIQKVIPYFLAQ